MSVLLGSQSAEVTTLADRVGARHVGIPDVARLDLGWHDATVLEAWRVEIVDGPSEARVVVAVWPPLGDPVPLVDADAAMWLARAELPLLWWTAALSAAAGCCADGGSIVAVVDRPAVLDCGGWSPQAGVADAVEAFARSLARSEGGRGVRVNVVTTSDRCGQPAPLSRPVLPPSPDPLSDTAGVVRMLLAAEPAGLTGVVFPADRGRSFR